MGFLGSMVVCETVTVSGDSKVLCACISSAYKIDASAVFGISLPTPSSEISKSRLQERFAIVTSVFPSLTEADTETEDLKSSLSVTKTLLTN